MMVPSFETAAIVSDLHLGGRDGFQMFASGNAFEALCVRLARECGGDNRTLLLINGDFVDFLAEDGAQPWNGLNAANMLRAIANRPAFEPVFRGLRRIIAKTDGHLTVVLGNHDLELVVPEVRQTFLELVCDGRDSRASRVSFAFDGWGYRFQVGNKRALATHGNETDPFNFTHYGQLNNIVREQQFDGTPDADIRWRPSAGAGLVIDAINPIKQEFAFVDLLKPLAAVMAAIPILDPSKFEYIDEAARAARAQWRNERNRPSEERRFLHTAPMTDQPRDWAGMPRGVPGSAQTESAIEIALRAERRLRDPTVDLDDVCYGDVEGELLGIGDWFNRTQEAVAETVRKGLSRAQAAADAAKLRAHRELLRSALRVAIGRSENAVDTLDSGDRSLLGYITRNYDVLLTGHTHSRRFVQLDSDSNVGHFVNTGTWAGLLEIPHRDLRSDTSFQPVYELLNESRRAVVQANSRYRTECPVAFLRARNNGVTLSLERMDGDELVDTDQEGNTFRTTL